MQKQSNSQRFVLCSPSENKETNNGTSVPKENDNKAEENSSIAKPVKESSGAVDFDLALDYEEDAPHSDIEGEIKEDANVKTIQHSQSKPKEDAESSDDSSGQGNYNFVLVFLEVILSLFFGLVFWFYNPKWTIQFVNLLRIRIGYLGETSRQESFGIA